MRVLSFCFLIFFKTNLICQELLLVIDEQFANKTFDSFNDVMYQNVPGDLHWSFNGGENDENGGFYRDTVANLDGTGIKNWNYTINQDGLIYFPRRENLFTNPDGVVLETNEHGVQNGVQMISGAEITYPWTFKRGYFEFEAKLPEGTGIMSSAFLFNTRDQIGFGCDGNGEDINWQEIDIWETNGNWPYRLRNNIHWSGYLPDPTFQCQDNAGESVCNEKCAEPFEGKDGTTEIDFTSDFHTIGLFWDQSYVIILIDGYIYRYWTKPKPINLSNGIPDYLIFLDAMILHIGAGYGTQHTNYLSGFPRVDENDPNSDLKPSYDFGDNLYGPNPNEPIPESELIIRSFKYWVFLPCEDSESNSSYNNVTEITNYNSVFYGHFETGKTVQIENSFIGPTTNPTNLAEELPYAYSDQLNLIASHSVTLSEGFHAKGALSNFPISSQFHAKIVTCANIPVSQPMPLINNLTDSPFSDTFLGDFHFALSDMIDQSWNDDGPLKNLEIDSILGIEKNPEFGKLIDTTHSHIGVDYFSELNLINIRLENDNVYASTYLIQNCIGQIIISENLGSNNSEIDISSFPSGVYFIKVISGDQILSSKKILKL